MHIPNTYADRVPLTTGRAREPDSIGNGCEWTNDSPPVKPKVSGEDGLANEVNSRARAAYNLMEPLDGLAVFRTSGAAMQVMECGNRAVTLVVCPR